MMNLSLRGRWRRVLVVGLVVLALAQASASAAQAKKAGPKKGGDAKQHEKYRGSGTIESIQAGSIVMTEKGGGKLTLEAGKNAKVRVTGTAERDYLKVGQMVQFSALVDKKSRRIKDPVKALLIFTPNQQYAAGCFPDMSANAPSAANDDPSVNWKPYILGGQIVLIKDDKLYLNIPDLSPRLMVDVDKALRIKFDVGDLSLARPGDTIQVSKAAKTSETRVAVHEATIKRVDPLTASSKPAAKPERK